MPPGAGSNSSAAMAQLDDFDDEEILRDVTHEEMSAAMQNSTRYVSKVFIDESHYQKIHKSLASQWDRLHSLSAAMKLMETYGVTLSAAEEKRLAGLDEAQQINALVSKMPNQSNDQFQQFFLQLQLLVSTAMRVRQSLEAGRPDEVEAALEDADTTGIAQYILKVAIVQAGSEVQALKNQFEGWTKEADGKMGRLLRGQQDNLTAQKKLAEAEAELARQNGEQNSKAAKAVINFAKGNDKALVQMIYQQWQHAAKVLRLEGLLRVEYADRLQDLEDNLAKWKAGQATATQNVMLRQIQQEQHALMGRIYDIWRKDVEEAKFMKENGEKVAEMEERLKNVKASQKENAAKVLGGMATASEKGLVDLVFKSWIQTRVDTIKAKQAQEARLADDSKLDKFTQGKSDEAKYLVRNFAGSNDNALKQQVLTGWIQINDERKKEAEIAEAMQKSSDKINNIQSRSKASAGSVMNKGAQHLQNQLMLRCLHAWHMDSRMEFTMKHHHCKIDAKRQQLVGVQQMFRNFATQLEGGLNKGKDGKDGQDSSRIFENRTAVKKKAAKDDGSRSLPEIKGSGRASASKPGSAGPGSGRASASKPAAAGGPKGAPGAIPPKTAWG